MNLKGVVDVDPEVPVGGGQRNSVHVRPSVGSSLIDSRDEDTRLFLVDAHVVVDTPFLEYIEGFPELHSVFRYDENIICIEKDFAACGSK